MSGSEPDWNALGMKPRPNGWRGWTLRRPLARLTTCDGAGMWDVVLNTSKCYAAFHDLTEPEAWTCCAALLLLASGVLPADGAEAPRG